MTAADRIEPAPACDVIRFTPTERAAHYTGAGWRLAVFAGGTLAGMFDPMDVAIAATDDQARANAMLAAALAWIKSTSGEVWLGMCSAGEFCEPVRAGLTDVAGLAKLARVCGDIAQGDW